MVTGRPIDNARIESFNGKFRGECLDQTIFRNIEKARALIEFWREHYNDARPHKYPRVLYMEFENLT